MARIKMHISKEILPFYPSSEVKYRLQNGVSTHPNTEEHLAYKRTMWHFWSAKWHFKRAYWSTFGLWPNFLQVAIRHTIFDLFAEGCVRISILIVRAYFLEFSHLYKLRLDLIIQGTFLCFERYMFLGSQIAHIC